MDRELKFVALFNGVIPNEMLIYRQMIINSEEGRMWEVADCFIRRDSSVSVVTSLLNGWQRNRASIPRIFFISATSIPAVRTTDPPFRWVPGLFPRV